MAIIVLFVVASCKPNPKSFQAEANSKTQKLLEESKLSVSSDSNVLRIRSFEKMTDAEFKIVFDGLIKKGTLIKYEAKIATVITPDCLANSSKKDSIYHSVLMNKIEELVGFNYIDKMNHKEILIHQDQIKRLAKELRSFCNEDSIKRMNEMVRESQQNLENK